MIKKNENLYQAKKTKNDEFYTQIPDIEKELKYYREHLKDKIIFCNCDDPEESHFWKYFALNFKFLGLKKLISTHFEADKLSYKLEITGDINNDGKIDKFDVVKTSLKQNGDFRSPECIEILKECDVVVTNPPFSLFREFVSQLIKYDKKFLIIGNMNAITYKEIFSLIKDNKIWLGHMSPKEFIKPDGVIQKFGNIKWFTNLPHDKRNENLILYKEYNEKDYPFYDNCEAININKVKDIPMNYTGVMGVPISFIDKFNPEQFDLLGIANSARWINYKCLTIVNNKNIYNRLFIKNKNI